MSEPTEDRSPEGSSRRLSAGVAVVLASAVLATGSTGTSTFAGLAEPSDERAAVWSHEGVGRSLPAEGDPVRIRIVLAEQPVLAAVSSGRIRSLVRPSPSPATRAAGRASPATITTTEKRAARRGEAGYERAISELVDEAAASGEDLRRVELAVRRIGGRGIDDELLPAAVLARVAPHLLNRIESLPGVAAVERAPVQIPLSGVGTEAVGAPSWWAAGLTGGTGASDTVPADAAIQSEAADPTHPAFAGVTVDNDPDGSVSDHGTHTGGIIASGDSTYPGVSYGVDRLIGSTGVAYALGIDSPSGPGAADPAEIINLSFGSTASAEDTDDSDDVLTSVFGVGQAQGAGNDNVDGSPSVANIGRNVLSVAAFNDVGTVASTDDVVLGVSSRGPTPGGRKKPDLTAPGGSVIAPSALWDSPPSNPDFTGASGTSFAAPHVAGAMTLLEGAGIGDPMAQRAILINSARDWNGTDTGLDGWAAPQAGWRPEVGWGQLDLSAALAERGNYQLGSVRGGEAAFYRATVPTGAKATLAFELRGFFVGFPNPGAQTIKYTQSNLDLRQYLPTGTEVVGPPDPGHGGGPDAVDPDDTVEQVRAPAGGPQAITYKVEAASTVEGAGSEPFAIAAAEPLIELEPPIVRPVSIGASPSGPFSCSDPVEITTTLRNDSADLESNAAEVALELPPGVDLIAGSLTQQVSGGDLGTEATSESHGWIVQATTNGTKQLKISGRGEGLGTPFERTESVQLEADCIPPSTSIDSGPLGATMDPDPTFTFSTPDGGAGFQCSVDAAPFANCVSPLTTPVLADGSHSFSVRAVDIAGNLDPDPPSSSFVVDTVPPETSIISGPEGPTRELRPEFGLSSEIGAEFECSLDSAAFTACGAIYRPGPLENGGHRVRARAIDQAGNVDPTVARRSLTVDRRVEGARLRRISKRLDLAKGVLGKVRVRIGEAGRVNLRASASTGKRSASLDVVDLEFAGKGFGVTRLRARRAGSQWIRRALRDSDRVSVRVTTRYVDELGNRSKRKLGFRIRTGNSS